WLMVGILVLLLVVFMVYNKRAQSKSQKEQAAMLDAIKPGNKVKTIGGICGVVVEVCPEDNTFVMETGTEASGKSYLKFDKQAVYQTDAVVNKETAPAAENVPVEETKEAPVEEVFEEEKKDETTEKTEE
ncbi:MAG: preprotein translocase subunit YajC, partial [Clostridia bacterium]|nr:preprotein translocase subunit YajC [Clostridia bacterium]